MAQTLSFGPLVANDVALGQVLDGNDGGGHSKIVKTESSQFKIRNKERRNQKFISAFPISALAFR
jgi:hypothetical protein